MKKMLCILFLISFFVTTGLFGACPLPPPMQGPGGDTPDDNYSYTSGNVDYQVGKFGEIYVFDIFQRESVRSFFKQYSKEVFFVGVGGNSIPNLVIVPTGGLFGLEDDLIFKTSLQEYVRLGGTVIVFAQQYGSHIDNVVPIPEGESLHTYGWREDQSCAGNAGYFKQMHPALASMTYQNVNINVDGYFGTYPSDTTVLLRRVSNQQPCLISYPYG
ncbi:MAG: hypothetical protein KJ754_15115, partial [Bacteroidetes bacterium]|nr:hypothetical protein [Bacteroidota bacterium]